MSNGRKLIKLTMLAWLGTCTSAAFAQTTAHTTPDSSAVKTVSGVRCGCGRWTCPACQQQQLCEPCPTGQTPAGQPAPIYSPEMSLSPAPAYPGAPGDGRGYQTEGYPPASNLNSGSTPATPLPPPASSAAPSLAPPASGPSASSLFASNMGAGGGGGFGSSLSGATTPEMMGDFFGPGGIPSVFQRNYYTYHTVVPSAGYALGRMKLAENSSPIPRDRVFFNYSLFTGVPLAQNPTSVNRFSPGFEKTFLDGLASFELRTPFGTTINNDILASGLTSDNDFQFGNLFLTLKGVLLQRDNWLLTGGTSLLLPTADDTRVIDPMTGSEFLRIDNKSTHIMPFIGGAYLPTNRLFAQWMVQCDIDANGNPVIATNNSEKEQIGTLQDFTLLYTDLSLGYWLYQAGGGNRRTITGIAPVAELHYNRALNNADVVFDANNIISGPIADFDNVNAQVGLIFNIHNNARLGLGYATPLGNSFDRVFDNEFRVTFNRYF